MSTFHLFLSIGERDQWWHTPVEKWRKDICSSFTSWVQRRWHARVSDSRLGRSIYLQLQPYLPHYYVYPNGVRVIPSLYVHAPDDDSGGGHHHIATRDTISIDRDNNSDDMPRRRDGSPSITEECRGGAMWSGSRWLVRYRIGDVPLNAMRAALYNNLPLNTVWSSMNMHSNTELTVSPLCSLCMGTHYDSVNDRIEDYNHIFFTCPVYHRARQLLQPSIDHVRHYLRTRRIAETIIPSDDGSDDMNESDVEQLWVAGTTQPSKDAKE